MENDKLFCSFGLINGKKRRGSMERTPCTREARRRVRQRTKKKIADLRSCKRYTRYVNSISSFEFEAIKSETSFSICVILLFQFSSGMFSVFCAFVKPIFGWLTSDFLGKNILIRYNLQLIYSLHQNPNICPFC